jgi:hypothetical protein
MLASLFLRAGAERRGRIFALIERGFAFREPLDVISFLAPCWLFID